MKIIVLILRPYLIKKIEKKIKQSQLIIQYTLYNLLQSHLIIQYTLIEINVYTIYILKRI